MQFLLYSHCEAQSVIPQAFQEQIVKSIASTSIKKPINTQKIRNSIIEPLFEYGWSNGIRVAPTNSKIDITSVNSNIGLCIQTGNISRFYADILKLQTLFAECKIIASIYIVPMKPLAKTFGQNIVNFERFVREIRIFKKTITVPILVYGIYE